MASTGELRRLVALIAAMVVASVVVPTVASAAPNAPDPEPVEAPLGKGDPSGLSPRLAAIDPESVGRRTTGPDEVGLGLPDSGPGSLLRDADGSLVVEARLDSVAPSVFAALEAAGATVTARADAERLVALRVPPHRLREVAAVRGVAWLQETLTPRSTRTGQDPPTPAPGTRSEATCAARIVSEGDALLRADIARDVHDVDGSGITVGILSDSFDRLGGAAADTAAGELPGPGNPCGRYAPVQIQSEHSGSAATALDEGRAMAQIVHDLAPGATLRFATAFNGEVDFASQIRRLAAAGASVIVDDIFYYEEPIYQDGVIAKAVADVSAADVTYVTAAGNDNIMSGFADVGSYEAPAFRPAGAAACPAALRAVSSTFRCHDFDTGPGVDVDDVIELDPGGEITVKLGWNEPTFGVQTDLDVFLLDGEEVVAVGGNDNVGGSGKPTELLFHANDTYERQSLRLVVARYGASTATPRFKTILMSQDVARVEYEVGAGGDVVGPSIFGHAASATAVNVAALPYNAPYYVQDFSSRGPAWVCIGPIVGTTPAAPLPGGCERRDVTVAGIDGVSNSFFGGWNAGAARFFGTSAAAPHVAAVAALGVEAAPCRNGTEMIDALQATAASVIAAGVAEVGAGRVVADAAVGALAPCVGAPGAPAGAYAVAGVDDAEVSWSPARANGSEITSYTVVPIRDGVAETPRTFPGSATSGTVSGLQAGSSYTFTVSATNAVGTGPSSPATNAVSPGLASQGTVYVPITPCRVLDTRAAGGPFGNGAERALQVAGSGISGQGGLAGCIPDGAAAAELSISVIAADGRGYLRAWPEGQSMPTATFLNHNDGSAATNTGAVALAASGRNDLRIANFGGARDVVIDVQGYYVPEAAAPPEGSVYVAIAPCRVLDTRSGGGAILPGATRHVQVAGTGIAGQGGSSACVPDGVGAVEASVSAVTPLGRGYVRAWPRDRAEPTATFLNYVTGEATTNTGAVPLARTGAQDLSVVNRGGLVHLVVDIHGYYVPRDGLPSGATGARYVPVTPCRVLDSRAGGVGIPVGTVAPYQVGGGVIEHQGALAGCIPDGVPAAEVSVSAVAPRATGFVRAFGIATTDPTATVLNVRAGRSTTNTGSVSLDPTAVRDLTLVNMGSTVNYVLDVQGYWTTGP